ncbi:hypothetical protein THRCLA_02451 [Thraustotheca clavata]|uniref:Transmembrane protein n=1 Tax=Thraustotheca clavata TaxID=74557 RepID=A0A1W0A546_9STRA|nr:hypothetical protein THRCLA_02451 [Thraustotheca clavata]
MYVKLYQLVLFATPQFYAFPWKPLINGFIGDSYPVAVAHFAPSHTTRANLALHAVCMVIQLTGNFCLLTLLDDLATGGVDRPLSLLTALVWSIYLILGANSAPVWSNFVAVCSILTAYFSAPYLLVFPEFTTTIPTIGFFVMAMYFALFAKGTVRIGTVAMYMGIMLVLHLLWWSLEAMEILIEHPRQWNLGFLVILAGLSLMKNPAIPTVVFGSLVGRTLASCTNQPLLFYFCYGYFGSLMQGIAHRITKEQATLLALENEVPLNKIRYEFAHVTYFPLLVCDAITQLNKERPPKQK